MNYNKKSRGFTLIELLVVIAIIALLSSIVLASLNTARKKGQDAKILSQYTQIRTALELYYADNGRYPIAAPGQMFCIGNTNCIHNNVAVNGLLADLELPDIYAENSNKLINTAEAQGVRYTIANNNYPLLTDTQGDQWRGYVYIGGATPAQNRIEFGTNYKQIQQSTVAQWVLQSSNY